MKAFITTVFLIIAFQFGFSQAPTIIKISNTKAVAGTKITLSGTNFNANSSQNIVFFGQVKAVVNSATTSSLEVTVPFGASYNNIIVLNLATGLYGYSTDSFNPVFISKNFITADDFRPKVEISETNTISHIGCGDLDGDGSPDIVLASNNQNGITILRNKGLKSKIITVADFVEKTEIPVNNDVTRTFIEDLDGDGKKDILALSSLGNKIYIFKNNTISGVINSSSFLPVGEISCSGNPKGFYISDLDLDGKPEIIASNTSENTISIFKNIGTKNNLSATSFSNPVKLITSNSPQQIEVKDLDKNGKPEIAVVNEAPGHSVSIFKNTSNVGSLSFALKFDIVAQFFPTAIKIADLDGDSNNDICVVTATKVQILKNNGSTDLTSSFVTTPQLNVDANSPTLSVADLDGDGKPDFIASSYNTGNLSIIRNKSASDNFKFEEKLNLGSGTNSLSSHAIADINGDGYPDIITSNLFSKKVIILQNIPAFPPKIVSFSPTKGEVGSTISIDGYYFNSNLSKNKVLVGNVEAQIISGTENQILIKLPSGFVNDKITITNTENRTSAISSNSLSVIFPSNKKITPSNFINNQKVIPLGQPFSTQKIGDLDGDGKPDLVTCYGSKIHINKNITKNGGLNAEFDNYVEFSIPSYSNTKEILLADVDSDGKLDIILNSGYTLLNKVNGPLSPNSFTLSNSVFSSGLNMKLTHLNLDGKLDYSKMPTDGILAVDSGSQIILSYDCSFYELADLDGDGKLDLIIIDRHNYSNSVLVMKNMSDNGNEISATMFAPPVIIGTDVNLKNLIIADLDGDNKLDIVTTSITNNTITIFQNKITGSNFSSNSFSKFSINTANHVHEINVADFDGDGKLDLVAVLLELNTLALFKNNYDGINFSGASFKKPVTLTINRPNNVTLTDINNDGKPDIVTSDDVYGLTFLINSTVEYSPPKITSFSPIKAKVGEEITIKGEQFNALKDSNVVYFGSLKADIISSSSTEIKVKVPAGKILSKISVLNIPNKLIGESKNEFVSIFESKKDIKKSDFEYPQYFNASKFAFADVDEDGKSDLLSVGEYGRYLYLIGLEKNSSTLTEFATTAFPKNIIQNRTNKNPTNLTVADIDQDGLLDVIMIDSTTNNLMVARNLSRYEGYNYKVELLVNETFTTGEAPADIKYADLDNDGRLDLVVINSKSNSISVFKSSSTRGTVSFEDKLDFNTGKKPCKIKLADLNNDTFVDIIVTNEDDNSISVFENISSPQGIVLKRAVNFAVGNKPIGVNTADLNEDNLLDIIVANYGDNSLFVLQNNTAGGLSNGAFIKAIEVATAKGPHDVAVDDLDGDGLLDIVVSNKDDNSISVLRNVGLKGNISNNSLDAKVDFETKGKPTMLTIGDMDNDGKPDIGVFCSEVGYTAIFKNNPVIPIIPNFAPAISSFYPARAEIGNTVTVKGKNFGTNVNDITILLGTIRAEITSINDSTIEMKIPPGAGYSKLYLTNTAKKLSCLSNNYFSVIFESKKSISSADYEEIEVKALDVEVEGIKIGDLNNDGFAEIIYSDPNNNTVYILENRNKEKTFSGNNFVEVLKYTNIRQAYKLLLFDVNADGKPDIIINSNPTKILLNISTAGKIAFEAPLDLNFDIIEFVDIDGDGLIDSYGGTAYDPSSFQPQAYHYITQNIAKNGLINQNSFTPYKKVNTRYNSQLAFNDFNNDGKPDIVNINSSYPAPEIFENISIAGGISSGSFNKKIILKETGEINGGFIIDIDNDGKNDLLLGNKVLKNNYLGGEITDSIFSIPIKANYFYGPTFADMDGDGKLEILSLNRAIKISRNNGVDGIITPNDFEMPITIGKNIFNFDFDVADMDADGRPDLIFTSYDPTHKLKIFRYNPKITPVVSLSNQVTNYNIGTNNPAKAIIIDTALIITYINHQYLSEATIILKDYKASEEELSIMPTPALGDIEANFDKATGILTLTSSSKQTTLSQWQNALRSVTYINNNINTNSITKELAFTISDGNKTSPISSKTITIYGNPKINTVNFLLALPTDEVYIIGENFNNVTEVSFGGTKATSFTINSRNIIVAVPGNGSSGEVTVVTKNGVTSKAGFKIASKPELIAEGSTTILEGGSLKLKVKDDLGVTYRWTYNNNIIPGVSTSSYTATRPGIYTVGVTIGNQYFISNTIEIKTAYFLPSNSFTVKGTSVGCKGSANGIINIEALETSNYFVNLYSGTSSTKSTTFTKSYQFQNLAPGLYNLRIFKTSSSSPYQDFSITISEPKDLSVYATVNPQTNLLNIKLNGSENYQVELNGQIFATSNTELSLPLKKGLNAVKVSTDKECQGVFQKVFNLSKDIIVYPNPFSGLLNIVIPETESKGIVVEIFNSNAVLIFIDHQNANDGKIKVDLSNLPVASYLLKVKTAETEQIFKIVKQ